MPVKVNRMQMEELKPFCKPWKGYTVIKQAKERGNGLRDNLKVHNG